MLHAIPRSASTAGGGACLGWTRHVQPVRDAVAGHHSHAPRVLVVGNAGSGKTTFLSRLADVLRESGRATTLLTGTGPDIAGLPASHVVLVDDLHLLRPDLIAAVRRRAENTDAGLVVASRPWPSTGATTAVARSLENARPAIILGHVGRSDVLDELELRRLSIPTACVDRILELTDGVSWLVADAIASHDERDCADDPDHRTLSRVLADRIAHRLDTVDDDVRRMVEMRCLAAAGQQPAPQEADAQEEGALRAYAEGLLLRGGLPAPAVRSAVRAGASVQTIARLTAGSAALPLAVARSDADYADMLTRLQAPGLGEALTAQADRILDAEPQRARELYDAAWDAGFRRSALRERRAHAAWAVGDLDAAATLAESAGAAGEGAAGAGAAGAGDGDGDGAASSPAPDGRALADLAAAVWAARGMMAQGHAMYRAVPPRTAESAARAAIAAIGAGDRAAVTAERGPITAEADAGADAIPSTLGTAMTLLRRGLAASLGDDVSEAVLVDLIRAAEMYTSARTTAPVPELPAVVAAIVALDVGDAETARSIVDDALAGGHGGQWARARLLLWRAWIAVQRIRPHDARTALAQAEAEPGQRSPRDRLLAHAVRVALARRYGDAADLADAWGSAHAAVLRVDVDAFLFLPLTELVCAAAKAGDPERATQTLARMLAIAGGLAPSPLWTARVHWAGVQRSILLGKPDELIPHAHALVAAGRHSAVASAMAKAGRVWTSVLAGSVDPDAVEAVTQKLAALGMAWDAARLAGHAAARTTDRRVGARLLAQARELHPIELEQKPRHATDGEAPSGGREAADSAAEVLSEREREVARLVLQGKTYAEIGEAIFISPRTAEHHIAHIRRRLGATSRSEVIAKLRLLMADHGPTDDTAGVRTETDADPHRAA